VTGILGAATIALLLAIVLMRVAILRRAGTVAVQFGKTDRRDFLIPPFAVFYFYLIFASALHWPTPLHSKMFDSTAAAWVGIASCIAALGLMFVTLLSFGQSFRIGIDTDHPGALVTSGAFAYTRNPIYVAFAAVLIGEFLILPHWVLLLYVVAGIALLHRQVLREETYLQSYYGSEFTRYRKRVPRYF